jgi:hypothetical protein
MTQIPTTLDDLLAIGKACEVEYQKIKPALLAWFKAQEIEYRLWPAICANLAAELVIEQAAKKGREVHHPLTQLRLELLKAMMDSRCQNQ